MNISIPVSVRAIEIAANNVLFKLKGTGHDVTFNKELSESNTEIVRVTIENCATNLAGVQASTAIAKAINHRGMSVRGLVAENHNGAWTVEFLIVGDSINEDLNSSIFNDETGDQASATDSGVIKVGQILERIKRDFAEIDWVIERTSE